MATTITVVEDVTSVSVSAISPSDASASASALAFTPHNVITATNVQTTCNTFMFLHKEIIKIPFFLTPPHSRIICFFLFFLCRRRRSRKQCYSVLF